VEPGGILDMPGRFADSIEGRANLRGANRSHGGTQLPQPHLEILGRGLGGHEPKPLMLGVAPGIDLGNEREISLPGRLMRLGTGRGQGRAVPGLSLKHDLEGASQAVQEAAIPGRPTRLVSLVRIPESKRRHLEDQVRRRVGAEAALAHPRDLHPHPELSMNYRRDAAGAAARGRSQGAQTRPRRARQPPRRAALNRTVSQPGSSNR